MPFGLTMLEGPAAEPITLTDVKRFASVDEDYTVDNALLTGLISASRVLAEKYCKRAFFDQTWLYSLDYFPLYWGRNTIKNIRDTIYPYSYYFDSAILLFPKPGLKSITSIKYYDTAGIQQTLDPSLYIVDTNSEPGRAFPKTYWPVTGVAWSPGGVQITYVASTYGSGEDTSKVPANVKTAIALGAAHWYNHREDSVPMPDAFYNLLNSEVFSTFSFNIY